MSRSEEFHGARSGEIRFEHRETGDEVGLQPREGDRPPMRLAAWFHGDNDVPIAGYIRHVPNTKGTRVDILHVEESRRRHGVATALMRQLESIYGSENIEHGGRTSEGSAWWEKYRGGDQ